MLPHRAAGGVGAAVSSAQRAAATPHGRIPLSSLLALRRAGGGSWLGGVAWLRTRAEDPWATLQLLQRWGEETAVTSPDQ